MGGCGMGGSCCGAIQGWRIDLCLQPLFLLSFLPVEGTRAPQGPRGASAGLAASGRVSE